MKKLAMMKKLAKLKKFAKLATIVREKEAMANSLVKKDREPSPTQRLNIVSASCN